MSRAILQQQRFGALDPEKLAGAVDLRPACVLCVDCLGAGAPAAFP